MMQDDYGEDELGEDGGLRASAEQIVNIEGTDIEKSSGGRAVSPSGALVGSGGSSRYAGSNSRRMTTSTNQPEPSNAFTAPYQPHPSLSRSHASSSSVYTIPVTSSSTKPRGSLVPGGGSAGTGLSPLSGGSSKPPWLDSPAAWMTYYFLANLSLTLYNKLLMNKFPFPWALTGIHTLCGALGCQVALQQGYFTQQRLSTNENLILAAFSTLYTVNIAVSNLSLNLVTVPFHQVVRAMTPIFIIILGTIFLKKRNSRATYLSLIPVILGVIFATYGDYYFTTWGLVLTLLGTVLAALKTIVTNIILVGRLKLQPLDLLARMSPLAFMQCVLASWWTGELDKVRQFGATEMDASHLGGLAINGAIAFALNVVSFTANKKTSALTMTVAANVKQVLTIILAVIIFHLHINPMNLFGISMTLFGGALYAKVELDQQKVKTLQTQKLVTSPLIGVVEEKRSLEKEQMR